MKKIMAYAFVFVVVMATFSAILPYPVFSAHTNINETDAFNINNIRETEISSANSTTPKLINLSFEDIDVLFPIGSTAEIYDLKTQNSFTVIRVGGKNHADVEPTDKANAQIIRSCVAEWGMERRSVLVHLSEYAYFPASLVYYPHGYTKTNQLYGHLCLHFKNSKTDGTNEMDYRHQKAVRQASKIKELSA